MSELQKLKQLEALVKETTGCHFKMSIQANSNNWTFYIFRSKMIFRGSFEKVINQAINEILKFRTPTPGNAPRNIIQAFQYLKGAPELQKEEEFLPKKLNDSYDSKLSFSKSIGFKNVADCYYEIGSIQFNKQFHEYQSNLV